MCKIISDSLEELDKLVEAYPRCIPLAAAAEFLGIAPETLRTSISQGKCSFGIADHPVLPVCDAGPYSVRRYQL